MRILQWSAVPASESHPRPPSDERGIERNGIIWVALGATLWGTDAVLRRPLTETLSSAEIVFFEHVILAVILLPVAIRARRRGASFTKAQWAALLWIGWGGSALATIFFTQAIKLGLAYTVVSASPKPVGTGPAQGQAEPFLARAAEDSHFFRHWSGTNECVFYNGLPCRRPNRIPDPLLTSEESNATASFGSPWARRFGERMPSYAVP